MGGHDPYEEARNRTFTYKEGTTSDDLINYIKNGIGGNQSHAGNILNDMLAAWDKGDEGSYGHYTSRLMTSNMFDEATNLADIMGSLYKDGYSQDELARMISEGKGVQHNGGQTGAQQILAGYGNNGSPTQAQQAFGGQGSNPLWSGMLDRKASNMTAPQGMQQQQPNGMLSALGRLRGR
jgi:hypothetical protein